MGGVSEVKRIRGKKHPLPSAGLQALREEYTRTISPTCALAAETLRVGFTANAGIHPASARRPAQSRPLCRGQPDWHAGW